MMRVCHLDTCPVGVATQNPVLRAALQRQAGVRRHLLRVHRRGGARAARRARLPHPRRGDRPGRRARRRARRSTTGRPPGSTCRRSSTWLARRRVRPVRRPGPPLHQAAGPRPRQGARQRADPDRRAGPRARRAGAGPARGPQRQPHRRHDARPRGHQALPRRGAARRHHRPDLDRLGRPVVRRLPAARASRCGSRATPTTTSARGSPAAGSWSGPTGRRPSPPSEQIIAGNVIGYGATVGRGLPPRRRGGAVLRPQLRRHRGRRGRGRPRLRVHDRRPRRRARPDRPQLRRRHERRLRVRARPRRGPGQPRAGRAQPLAEFEDTSAHDELRDLVARHAEETGSTVAEELLADWAAALAPVHAGDAARLPAGARRTGGGRGRGPRRRRRRPHGSWRCCMADPKGFLKNGREVAERRPVEERVQDWDEVYPDGVGPRAAADHQHPGRAAAWTAASRSATRAARWAT